MAEKTSNVLSKHLPVLSESLYVSCSAAMSYRLLMKTHYPTGISHPLADGAFCRVHRLPLSV